MFTIGTGFVQEEDSKERYGQLSFGLGVLPTHVDRFPAE